SIAVRPSFGAYNRSCCTMSPVYGSSAGEVNCRKTRSNTPPGSRLYTQRHCWLLWCCWLRPLTSEFSYREIMLPYLSKTISALCDAIAVTQDHRAAGAPATSYDDVAEFVLEQLRKMPPFLSWPVLLATSAFGMSRLL